LDLINTLALHFGPGDLEFGLSVGQWLTSRKCYYDEDEKSIEGMPTGRFVHLVAYL
jgi:hypothetical protein